MLCWCPLQEESLRAQTSAADKRDAELAAEAARYVCIKFALSAAGLFAADSTHFADVHSQGQQPGVLGIEHVPGQSPPP